MAYSILCRIKHCDTQSALREQPFREPSPDVINNEMDCMKSLYMLVALATVSGATHAALPKAVPLKQVKPLVNMYLQAVECTDGDELEPKLATRYTDKANGVDGYIIITSVDFGCAGGSGTVGPALVFVRVASGKEGTGNELSHLKVDPALSYPAADFGAPRALKSVYTKDGQLYGTGLEHGKDDANCCPSIKSNYKITLVKKMVQVAKDDNRAMWSWILTNVGAR